MWLTNRVRYAAGQLLTTSQLSKDRLGRRFCFCTCLLTHAFPLSFLLVPGGLLL